MNVVCIKCHSHQRHKAKGLCLNCYHASRKDEMKVIRRRYYEKVRTQDGFKKHQLEYNKKWRTEINPIKYKNGRKKVGLKRRFRNFIYGGRGRKGLVIRDDLGNMIQTNIQPTRRRNEKDITIYKIELFKSILK